MLRGRFTPNAGTLEWCERRLLARIHRYTLGRLRREIEPVSRAEFTRFLFEWQRVNPADRRHGLESLAAVIADLEGFAAPAAAWEDEILPARIADFTPDMLDRLCLAGRASWARPAPPVRETPTRSFGPVRSTPIALFSRPGRRLAPLWLAPGAGEGEATNGAGASPASSGTQPPPCSTGGEENDQQGAPSSRARESAVSGNGSAPPASLSPGARDVLACLQTRGASFFDDILAETGARGPDAAAAIGELIAHGLVSADAFAGLRAFTRGSARRLHAIAEAGRWSHVHRRDPSAATLDEDQAEGIVRTLLRRYGVVFKTLLARETLGVPWRDLLRALRRLEARGDIRGGRFVAGFTGEQYALPEAVETLRRVRRAAPDGAVLTVSAADPLNVTGIITLGDRFPATASTRVAFRDGVPVATQSGNRRVEFLESLSPQQEWAVRNALLRKRIPVSGISTPLPSRLL